MIRVLVIGPSQPDDLADAVGLPGGAGDGFAGLSLLQTSDLDAAANTALTGRADAVLLNRGWRRGRSAIAKLRKRVPDLPILVVLPTLDADDETETIAAFMAEGAQDLLSPADVAPGRLRRRVELAMARKRFEAERVRQARRDPQTGLANGALLKERFVRALARADRGETLVGLVAIDVDGFDRLTDRHGHADADHLLTLAGRRLADETRKIDTFARTRDHGFTWLVEGLSAIGDINALVDRVPRLMAEPFMIGDREISITASVGVAVAPFHGRDFRTVHSMAEAAMLDVASISGDALLMPPLPCNPKPQNASALL